MKKIGCFKVGGRFLRSLVILQMIKNGDIKALKDKGFMLLGSNKESTFR